MSRIGWLSAAITVVALVGLISVNSEGAAPTDKPVAAAGVEPEVADAISKKLLATFPNLPIETLFKVPMPGLVGVELDGGQIVYVSNDGNFLLSGDLYQIESDVVNLAETRRSMRRQAIMAEIPRDEMVVFSPAGETRAFISVFTDVDCGYCRKLHLEVPELNAQGVEVRYLAYPRAGLNTPTYDKIVSAWCAQDPNEALTAVKAGETIAPRQCVNPVADQFEIGQKIGVTGTPAIVTQGGQLLPGYMPADDLVAALGLE